MYRARAVVMPSIWSEPFGRIPVEANRLGVPAVVTDRGALPETVENGITGLVTDVSADKIADTLHRLITHYNFNREHITRFVNKKLDTRTIVSSLVRFLEEAIR
jgi:glycosyltransferase involved in cell wall biosynthesis